MLVGVNIVLMESSATAKRAYHHGDLRNALAEAATQLAKEGGPESVTVRAAARTVGVTPTAAYRHFNGHEELLHEAKLACITELGAAMRRAVSELPPTGSRLHQALRNLAAAGRAYIAFAAAEPGLFRTAFSQGGAVLDKPPDEARDDRAFGMLIVLLDELVEVGYLPRERRPMAEVAAWSVSHGLAVLLLDGPLRDVPEQAKEEAVTRSLLMALRGLGPDDPSPELEATLLAAVCPK
jgi:AcrR family transcriptional regulator